MVGSAGTDRQENPEEKEPKAFVVCLMRPLRRKKKEMEILRNQITVTNKAYWGSQRKLSS